MNKIWLWILLSFSMLFAMGIFQYPDKLLHVVVCDVGQGDSVLIYRRFSQILIDGGANDLVSDCLLDHIPWFDNKIDIIILTHPQEDHMKGLVEVVKNYEVGLLLTSGGMNDTKTFWEFRKNIMQKEIKTMIVSLGDRLRIGEIELEVKWPDVSRISSDKWNQISSSKELSKYIKDYKGSVLGASSYDPNDDSLVVEVDFRNVSLLSAGDIGIKQEQALLGLGVITPVNVLKVAHHGSKYSSDLEFLEVARPKWALVSVGKNNRFGHPSREVLMYLDTVGAKILRTDEYGTIEIVSDGKEFWVK